MKISIADLKTDRLWHSVLGVPKEKFYKILPVFELCFIEKYGVPIGLMMQRLAIAHPILPDYEACLFFVLFQMKNGLTFDVLGMMFETDGGNAQRNFKRYSGLLETALHKMQQLPAREFETAAEMENHFAPEKELIIDATELCVERPKDKEQQKAAYSGKKKPM